MTAPVTDKPISDKVPSDRWPLNAYVVVAGLITLFGLAWLSLHYLVTSSPTPDGGKVGASDAISLITSSGAILTGIIGAYFGVNIASKSANAAKDTQAQANEAHKTAIAAAKETQAQVNDAQKTAIAAVAALDPDSPTAQQLLRNITT